MRFIEQPRMRSCCATVAGAVPSLVRVRARSPRTHVPPYPKKKGSKAGSHCLPVQADVLLPWRVFVTLLAAVCGRLYNGPGQEPAACAAHLTPCLSLSCL